MMILSGVSVACTAATSTVQQGLRDDVSLAQLTPDERGAMRDSSAAQAVADEVGPRVTVTADFNNESGSRRVDATFHMYDDAYVIVGHLDGAGRMKVVFPSHPGDDGFVRGDNVYHVPAFFAGFTDEYGWRYSDYYYRAHSTASRRDSYDAGLGYVFVIASWRPMRLDRIADADRWQTYNVSDVSYMSDPREAIEELGSLIAGDNREAYTIEYAHYSTTNYGMYSMADFDAVNSGCYGYRSSLGFSPVGHLFFSPFDFMPGYGFGFGPVGCGQSYYGYPYTYAYGYPYGGVYGYPVGSTPPPIYGAPGRRGPIGTPLGMPGLHLPRTPSGPGALALHDPGTKVVPTTPGSGTSLYRRPGLITEDAGGPRAPGERQQPGNALGITSNRPTIQQMIGSHHIEDAARGESFGGTTSNAPTWASHGGGYSAPRGGEAHTNWSNGNSAPHQTGRGYTPSYSAPHQSHGGGEGARMTPSHAAPPHGESTRSAPAPSSPAAHSSPPPASSSSGSKKP
ncbi:MAG TPA: hypothetical protein VGJ18_07650 [Gemmatimonadaceae bacterium]|jgi:hypothetical protein